MTMRTPDKALEDLNKILDISRAMVATDDLDELLNLIIEKTLDLLGVERATLFLYDKEQHELTARIATGVEELRVPADKGFCGTTVQTGQTIVVPDAYADPRFNPEVDKQTGFRTRNIMSVPLLGYEGELVGVLQVLNHNDGDFQEYDINLAETLAAQAGVVIQRHRLFQHFLQKQEMQRAMEIARNIQRSLLPDNPPDVQNFSIAGLSDPADETGGDTYDFIPLSNGHWAFVVADATGHGIGPALVIAETRAMLRASAKFIQPTGESVSRILQTVNTLLEEDLSGGSFVTCFLGILNPETGELTYASAGHGPMIFYERAADVFHAIPATSLPLGVMDDTEYDKIKTYRFQPGDWAVITTDGIFEAMNAEKELFGIDRMNDIIRRDREQTAPEMIANLRQAVNTFSFGPQADDITAIAIRRN